MVDDKSFEGEVLPERKDEASLPRKHVPSLVEACPALVEGGGNPGFPPGFRVALTAARLPGMTGYHEHSTLVEDFVSERRNAGPL